LGRYPEPAALLKRRILRNPDTDTSRVWLAAACGQMGQFEEAREAWREALRVNRPIRLNIAGRCCRIGTLRISRRSWTASARRGCRRSEAGRSLRGRAHAHLSSAYPRFEALCALTASRSAFFIAAGPHASGGFAARTRVESGWTGGRTATDLYHKSLKLQIDHKVSVTFMRCGGRSGSRPRRRAVASATR
jgi:hypothetical protein